MELRDFGKADMVVVLVGNKSDLGQSREVTEEEGKGLAEKEGLCFMETSALENLNVEEAFLHMITKIHEITTQKSLQAKLMVNDQIAPKSLNSAKQIIHINNDQYEVTATKQTSFCCST